MMNYPTLQEVEQADHEQLARWYRFLPSPGTLTGLHYDDPKHEQKREEQEQIMNRICVRFKEMGFFTPVISKAIGWGN